MERIDLLEKDISIVGCEIKEDKLLPVVKEQSKNKKDHSSYKKICRAFVYQGKNWKRVLNKGIQAT
ncbi:MAG: hypothetical protein KBT11_10735 [Treponema sp.]|nr:hypothetical protein [Candidatus Treponema equifaecale]